MIEKGLKVGDFFRDGESCYIVEEALENGNYISRRVSAKEKEEIEAEKKAKVSREKAARGKAAKGKTEDSGNDTPVNNEAGDTGGNAGKHEDSKKENG